MSSEPTRYHTIQVDGVNIFYREAGLRTAPVLLLLHGFPSSGRMFEPLLKRLSDQYYLIAPDYPGFGHSDWPDPASFPYCFDTIAAIMTRFAEALGLQKYTLFVQDYGGPVGFRMILEHPEKLQALIVQNAVAHNEGLGEAWAGRQAFCADRHTYEQELRKNFLAFATTKSRHIGSDPRADLYDPDLWTDEHRFLSSAGQTQIQSDLFYDYRTNADAYPTWQEWLQKNQPRLLVLWGRYDPSFDGGEPERFRRDVPDAEVHILDAGHFAMDTKAEEIAGLIGGFLRGRKQDADSRDDDGMRPQT